MKSVTYHPIRRRLHRERPFLVISIIAAVLWVLLSIYRPVQNPIFESDSTTETYEEEIYE